MVYLQYSKNKIQEIINLLQKEIDKEPDGFITIEIKYHDEKKDYELICPSPSYIED